LSVLVAGRSEMLAIVVLQHGRWRDTICCLQSIVPAVQAGLARVIVVDNASPDDSVARLHTWIGGGLPPVARPVHDTVASHWWPLVGAGAEWSIAETAADTSQHSLWTLVRSFDNRGFAAGMNQGLRIALADRRVDAVWLLNNDTIVAADAAAAVCAAVAGAPAQVGQFGTTVCYYDRPTIVQSVGWCRWNAWLATTHRVHDGASLSQPLSRDPHMPGYVYGASWILRSQALRDVGLLSEESFLYGEELDWTCRAAPRWQTQLIADAVVWHREGSTIGAGRNQPSARNELVDLCGISARLRLTRRFFPERLPAVYSSLFGAALNRLRRGDARRAAAVARLVLGGGLPAPRPTPLADSRATHPL
jgi:GT2 family glycosyltransferase